MYSVRCTEYEGWRKREFSDIVAMAGRPVVWLTANSLVGNGNQIHSIGESSWIMHQSAARDSIQIWMLIGIEGERERALRSTSSSRTTRSRVWCSAVFCMDTAIRRLISGIRVEHTCQTNLTNSSNTVYSYIGFDILNRVPRI